MPLRGSDPVALTGQGHLLDPVGHVNRVAPTDRAEDVQGTRGLVRVGTLQQQHRAMIGQAPHPLHQPRCGGRMQVQRVIGRVPGHHGGLRPLRHGPLDGSAEAALGLGECPCSIVQVGKVCDAHGLLLQAPRPSSASILSR